MEIDKGEENKVKRYRRHRLDCRGDILHCCWYCLESQQLWGKVKLTIFYIWRPRQLHWDSKCHLHWEPSRKCETLLLVWASTIKAVGQWPQCRCLQLELWSRNWQGGHCSRGLTDLPGSQSSTLVASYWKIPKCIWERQPWEVLTVGEQAGKSLSEVQYLMNTEQGPEVIGLACFMLQSARSSHWCHGLTVNRALHPALS